MTLEQKLFIDLLKASMTGLPATLTEEPDWQSLTQLARIHNLGAMVYDGLRKSGLSAPEEAAQKLHQAYMQAIFRDVQLEQISEQLGAALENAGVDHIFLKGSVLKHNYPIPALRTMSDIDILVYAKDFEKIAQVAKEMNAKACAGDGNHRNYVFGKYVTVEFHPNLLHHATPIGTDINPGWQYAKESSRHGKELTEEGFYLNTICHLANHFVAGGVGVRFVLDVWVNRHLREPKADRAFVEESLQQFGLLDFAQKIEQLADAWFGQAPMTSLLEELGEYILTSGSHGTTDRAILNAMSLSPGGSRLSALWKKAFYPRAELEDRYPWCKGKPLLLPAAWMARAYRAVTQNGNLIAKWSKGSGKIQKAEVAENKAKMHRFGIKQKDNQG